MTAKDIVRDYLKTNGFDGLCAECCGCGIDDLAPCSGWGGSFFDCKPAYAAQKKCGDCENPCDAYDDDGVEKTCYTTKKPEEKDLQS